MTQHCPVCGKRSLPGYQTCGASVCQEISYYRNLLTNKVRRTKSEREEINERLNELEAAI